MAAERDGVERSDDDGVFDFVFVLECDARWEADVAPLRGQSRRWDVLFGIAGGRDAGECLARREVGWGGVFVFVLVEGGSSVATTLA